MAQAFWYYHLNICLSQCLSQVCVDSNSLCLFFQPAEDISVVSWNRQVQHILASANPSGKAVVWDLRKNEPIIKISDHSNRVSGFNTEYSKTESLNKSVVPCRKATLIIPSLLCYVILDALFRNAVAP